MIFPLSGSSTDLLITFGAGIKLSPQPLNIIAWSGRKFNLTRSAGKVAVRLGPFLQAHIVIHRAVDDRRHIPAGSIGEARESLQAAHLEGSITGAV